MIHENSSKFNPVTVEPLLALSFFFFIFLLTLRNVAFNTYSVFIYLFDSDIYLESFQNY